MKKDFETFYNELDKSKLEEVWNEANIEKKKAKKRAIIVITIIDAIILIFFMKYMLSGITSNLLRSVGSIMFIFFPLFFVFVFDVIIAAFIMTFSKANKEYVKYNNLYKENVIEQLLNNFFTEVDYIPNKAMDKNKYNEIFKSYYDRYSSDDYMDATINDKYRMSMANILTTREESYKDSNGNTRTRTVIVFSGIFGEINIGKSINNELRITYNTGIKTKQKVNMDSQEFEKYFDVYSTNNIVTMQLLTHDVMSLLVDFRKIFKFPFEVVIKNNMLYIRLHVGAIFEGKLNKDEIVDKEIAQRYFNILDFINVLTKEIIKVVEETEV